MLTFNRTAKKTNYKVIALLLSFSLIAFHQRVFAESKEQVIEQYRLKGYEAQRKGNFQDAFTYYSKAISLGLENAVVLNDLAVLSEQINLPLKAEQYYLSAIQIDKDYLPPYMNLAYFYQKNGQTELAFEYFKKRFERGEGESDSWAEKAKEEILNIHPEYFDWVLSVEVKSLSAQAEGLAKERKKKEQEELERIQKELFSKVEQSKKLCLRGQKFFEKSDYELAVQEYDKALVLTPGDLNIMSARDRAVQKIMKENVQRRSEMAVQMLDSGDSYSSRNEFQKILTIISNEPGSNSN